MATYAELQAQIQALTQQAQEARRQEVGAAIAEIRQKMAEYGLTAADLGGTTRRSAARGSKVAPKYRNQMTGETWTGRGKRPRWLAQEIANGKSLEAFMI